MQSHHFFVQPILSQHNDLTTLVQPSHNLKVWAYDDRDVHVDTTPSTSKSSTSARASTMEKAREGAVPLRLLASSAFGGWLRQEAYREYLDPVTGETARHCRLQLAPAVTTPFTAGGEGEGVEGREGVGEGSVDMLSSIKASPPSSSATTTTTTTTTTPDTTTAIPDSADAVSGAWSWPGPDSVSPSTGLSAEADLVASCGVGPYPCASSLQRKRAQVIPLSVINIYTRSTPHYF